MENILRIDVSATGGPAAAVSPVGRYAGLGGRALTSTLVWEEVPPLCDPLGPENKLVLAPGMMSGSAATTSGRISVGCKSPLTGGIKEANAGGQASQYLARLGYAAVVLEGERQSDDLYQVFIGRDGVRITLCNEYRLLGNYELAARIKEVYGERVAMISIGPAGERGFSNSTVAFTDGEFRPTRHAARGGVGAVMGAKGIKVIVVDPEGTSPRQPADSEAFREANRQLAAAVRASEMTGQGLPAYGTAMLMDITNQAGCFPAYNFSRGRFDQATAINGSTLAALEEQRGGPGAATHGCHSGCQIKCSGIFTDENGDYVTKQPEYETLWAHGGNCGIADLDALARIDRLNDDFGLDTMETGCTMGVLMEAGVLEFGDATGVIDLLQEIGQGTEKGRLLGAGTAAVARHYQVERAPVVKGQAMAAYDPRAMKGMGVTYATSTMGADHTAGFTLGNHLFGLEPTSDPLDADNQLLPSAVAQISAAAFDATGFCLFLGMASIDKPEVIKYILDSMSAFTGLGFNENTFAALGIRVLRLERDFNRRAGFTSADDRLPAWLTKEPLPPHETVFDVPEATLDQVHNHIGVVLAMLGDTKMAFAPPIALMGAGCHRLVPDNLAAMGLKKPLIVTDKGVAAAGLLTQLQAALEAKFFPYAVYDGTQPNPTVANVEEGLAVFRREGCDCLISLGGGSPHDCAKAIGVMVNNPGSILDYMGLFAVWRPLPVLVAVNTTSGTGAEATFAAVISDPERHLKAPIADPKLLPIVAVNDPLLTRSMPPHITAGTGMDALTHAIEAYTSRLTTSYAQGLALSAIKNIAVYLPRAVKNGDDLEARDHMCQAQYCAGLAFNSAQLGNVHSLAHALGAIYNLPHGNANAVMLPLVMEKNRPAIVGELAEIAAALGVDTSGMTAEAAADAAIAAVRSLMAEIGVPDKITTLAERCGVKVDEADIPELVAHAAADVCTSANPVPYAPADFAELYRRAWA
ncbi:MAG: iron-containing alcohol dehydrogenase [Deltaproteobacteria bacterium]|nr:iron-containing alcohol dehydrogenase [Deltaproteobacteria bacterium]